MAEPPSVGVLGTVIGAGNSLYDIIETILKGHSFVHYVHSPEKTEALLWKVDGDVLSPQTGVNLIRESGMWIAHKQLDVAGFYILEFRSPAAGVLKRILLRVVDTAIEGYWV